MGGEVDLITQWWVQTDEYGYQRELAAEILLENLKFGFTAVIANMNVSISIDEIKSTTVVPQYCSYGTINKIVFKTELNFFFTTFKVFINQTLNKMDIVIPSDIGGIFILSDLYVEYYNDYIFAGATPTFIGEPSNAAALHYFLTNPQLPQI